MITPRTPPIVERERELAGIDRLIDGVRSGRGGALVLEGPAGIGRTALLATARDRALRAGVRVLRARGVELEQDFAFGIVRQFVEPLLAEMRDDERTRLLDGPAGRAASLLGLPHGRSAAGSLAPVPPDTPFAVLHGLHRLCVNCSATSPLLIVVDDAQWADLASLQLLAFLLPRLEELPIGVMLTVRPGDAAGRSEMLTVLMTDHATERMTIRPLATGGVASVVEAGLGVAADPAFVAACREATGGAPLLVHALVDGLREAGITPDSASTGRVREVATDRLRRWSLRQIARLGPDAVRLARAVAILERCSPAQAARVAGLDAGDAAGAAALLCGARVLEEEPLRFAHPLVREGVYREIPPAERGAAHARAARVLADDGADAAAVAAQLLFTAPTADAWVVDQLVAAARDAFARGTPAPAFACLRHALSGRPTAGVVAGILRDLALGELGAGEPRWEHHLRGALRQAADDGTRTEVALLLAEALQGEQRLSEAVAVCEDVASQLDGRDHDARSRLEAMIVACGLQDVAVAASLGGRAGALLSQAGAESPPSEVRSVAAWVAALRNRPPRDDLDATLLPSPLLTLSRLGSDRPAIAARAWSALRRGDLAAAEVDARALVDTTSPPPPRLAGLVGGVVLIQTLVERGELDEAEDRLQPLVSDLQGATQAAALLRHARGRLRCAQQRHDEAVDDFHAAGELARRTGAPSPWFLPWRSDAALAHLALGDQEAARRLSEEELGLARVFGCLRTVGIALRAAGVVAGGDRGEGLLREAVEVLRGSGARLELAGALADLGAVLRRGGRRADARAVLREAAGTAHELGAAPLATRAERELRAAGARPRHGPQAGLEALSAGERRIAELAAEGLSNPQIAEMLFLAVRTVEGHLTRVFSKLDVSARSKLSAALRPRVAA